MNPITIIALVGVAYFLVKDKVADISNKLKFGIRAIKYTGKIDIVNKQTGKTVKVYRFTANFLLTNLNNATLKISTFQGMVFFGSDGISIINFSPSVIATNQTAVFPIEILLPFGDALAALIKILTGSAFETETKYNGLHLKGNISGAYGVLPFSAPFDEPINYTLQGLTAQETGIENIEDLKTDLNAE